MSPHEIVWCGVLSLFMTILAVLYISARHKMTMCATGKDLRCNNFCFCSTQSATKTESEQVSIFQYTENTDNYDILKLSSGVCIGFVTCSSRFTNKDISDKFTADGTTFYLPDSKTTTVDCSNATDSEDVCCGDKLAFTTKTRPGVSVGVSYVIPFTVSNNIIQAIGNGVSGYTATGNKIKTYFDLNTDWAEDQFNIKLGDDSTSVTQTPSFLNKIKLPGSGSYFNIVDDVDEMRKNIEKNGLEVENFSVCIEPSITSQPTVCDDEHMSGWYLIDPDDTKVSQKVLISDYQKKGSVTTTLSNGDNGGIEIGNKYFVFCRRGTNKVIAPDNKEGDGGNPRAVVVNEGTAHGEAAFPIPNDINALSTFKDDPINIGGEKLSGSSSPTDFKNPAGDTNNNRNPAYGGQFDTAAKTMTNGSKQIETENTSTNRKTNLMCSGFTTGTRNTNLATTIYSTHAQYGYIAFSETTPYKRPGT